MDGEPAYAGVAVDVGEYLDYGVAHSAGGPVVFGDDDVAGLACRADQGGRVERLDGVEVDDASADAELDQRFGGGKRLVDGGAGADQRHVVVA